MEKEYILFGKSVTLPENAAFDAHVPYLNDMFSAFSKYITDDIEILKTMAFYIVGQRHFIGKHGADEDCLITALGKEYSFHASEKEIVYYKDVAETVNSLFIHYMITGEDEKKVLPYFLLSLADNIEIDLINYNIDRAFDFFECPSNKVTMFIFLDKALDAMEIWAQRGFDETQPRPCFVPYKDYHRQDQVFATLNRLFDAIRLGPQRLDSDNRYQQIDLRISRFRYILTLAPIGMYNYSKDTLSLQNALFCSNYEQLRCNAFINESQKLCANIQEHNYVRRNKRRFNYLVRGAGNLATNGSDATRAIVSKEILDIAFALDQAQQYDYAKKAYYKAMLLLNPDNPWLVNQEELRSIAFIGHNAMCECCQ